MAHEVETMAFVGETPWHGLGVKLETAPATVAEALKLGGLDWTIGLEPMQLADGIKVPDKFAVVRQTDRSVLGVVGKLWEPVQPADAFAPFAPFLASGQVKIETVGSLRGGKKIWMLAKIDRPDAMIVQKADDRIEKFLLVAIGNDGKTAFIMGICATRVVCMNTLHVAMSEDGGSNYIRIPHLSGANRAIGQVSAVIDRVDASIEKSAMVFRDLAGKRVRSEAKIREYIEAVFPRKKASQKLDGAAMLGELLAKPHNSITLSDRHEPTDTKSHLHESVLHLFENGRGNNLPGVKGTAWAAYNAVTEYLTWERGQNADTRIENLWFKDTATSERALVEAQRIFLSA